MKTFKIILFLISLLVILTLYVSCISKAENGFSKEVEYSIIEKSVLHSDTNKIYITKDTIDIDSCINIVKDTLKYDVVKKKVESIKIDAIVKIKVKTQIQKLEKTEQVLDEQTKLIDSLLKSKKK